MWVLGTTNKTSLSFQRQVFGFNDVLIAATEGWEAPVGLLTG